MSLRARITALCAACLAATILLAAVGIYAGIRSQQLEQVEGSLRRTTDSLQRASLPRAPSQPGGGNRPPFAPPQLPDLAERARRAPFGGAAGFVQFLDRSGRVQRPPDERGKLTPTPEQLAIARSGRGERVDIRPADGTRVLVLTRGVGVGAYQAARPLDEVDAALRHVAVVLAIAGVGAVALVTLLAFALARTALGPVAAFTRRAEEIAQARELSLRMEHGGDDELGRLAATFNRTLEELEGSARSQRQLVADASHELRTPLASLRANIQVLEEAERLPAEELARLRADVIAEIDELTTLVGDVVELARGEDAQAEREPVALDRLVHELAGRAASRATNRIELDLDLEPAVVVGDVARISRAVSNLLDNAQKWSPEGSTVHVQVRGGTVSVRDEGPGFLESDLPHVFERFYRSSRDRTVPGSGLGLAIVAQAAQQHGGSVAAANAPGGGAEIRVSFGPVVD